MSHAVIEQRLDELAKDVRKLQDSQQRLQQDLVAARRAREVAEETAARQATQLVNQAERIAALEAKLADMRGHLTRQ